MRVTYDQCRVLAHIERDQFTTVERIITATGIPELRVRSALRSLRRMRMGGFSRNGGGYVSSGWHETDGHLFVTQQEMFGIAREWELEHGHRRQGHC